MRTGNHRIRRSEVGFPAPQLDPSFVVVILIRMALVTVIAAAALDLNYTILWLCLAVWGTAVTVMAVPASTVSVTVIGGVDTHKHTHYLSGV